jgi:hypothetical protein
MDIKGLSRQKGVVQNQIPTARGLKMLYSFRAAVAQACREGDLYFAVVIPDTLILCSLPQVVEVDLVQAAV